MTKWKQEPSVETSRWLSREFSELALEVQAYEAQTGEKAPLFDLLIVGSGYGAAIAASELAGCQDGGKDIRIGLLERGREYLPGAFPSNMADLPKQVRGGIGGRVRGGEGLFDFRGGPDVGAIVANGLGGGSLINAGVMEIPKDHIFDQRWPEALRSAQARQPFYERAKRLLGAAIADSDNHISLHLRVPPEGLKKTQVLRRLGQRSSDYGDSHRFREAAITVAMSAKQTSGGVQLNPCTLCGDCATGCNHGAKESLDTNLLAKALRRGAELYCGATVLRLERLTGLGWRVLVTHSDEQRRRCEGVAYWITARRVIVAAGTLGTTEILLRSQRQSGSVLFSRLLGKHFSANGDMLTFGYNYGTNGEANAIANEGIDPTLRMVGPTITGIVDADLKPQDGVAQNIVIEELAVPAPLRRLAEETITTTNTLHALGKMDCSTHHGGHPENDPYAVNPNKLKSTSFFASIGDDGAQGTLRFIEQDGCDDGDGFLSIDWPEAKNLPVFNAQFEQLRQFASEAGFGSCTFPNPLWRLVPDSMAFLLQNARGPILTVHPLGGCRMGPSVEYGVVDEFGQVYNAAPPRADGQLSPQYHEGLIVLDGAILPSALATNPALTIAALSLRAVEKLRVQWKWQSPAETPPQAAVPRPIIADSTGAPPPEVPAVKTRVEFHERLSGAVPFTNDHGESDEYWIELTLLYPDVVLEHLFRPSDASGALGQATLKVGQPAKAATDSLLRIFRRSDFKNPEHWDRLCCGDLRNEIKQSYDQHANAYAVAGTLTILKREPSSTLGRTVRGLTAWTLNRGLRDIYQATLERLGQARAGYLSTGSGLLQQIKGALQLASHAGEVRSFDYELTIGTQLHAAFPLQLDGRKIRGLKRITYSRPSNPWRQLQEMTLTDFPVRSISSRQPVLSLDLRDLAANHIPLFRFTAQENQVWALMDVASLGAYFARMLVTIHTWSLRKPDAPADRRIDRLPGLLPDLPDPDIHTIDVDRLNDTPVQVRLTRYRSEQLLKESASTSQPPLLMFHGYSASGTTFAHPALEPGLARYFAMRGRDVWVVDLRSSSGLPTALMPWTFEQIALADIPAAIDYVFWKTGEKPVDVIAHCMGAAMFSMAVLSARGSAETVLGPRATDYSDRFQAERAALPGRIRRTVLSQIGPVMVMTPQNIFRAFILSFVQQLLTPLHYSFRPTRDQGALLDGLDRLFATIPYSDDELLAENPWLPWRRTEYVGTRHRMDALYGRTFRLDNLAPRILQRIDDFFGPISLDTVSQVIHFSRYQTITNRAGRNRFVSHDSLRELWKFPTLSIHGVENGLADVATVFRMHDVLSIAGCPIQVYRAPGRGHQDSLIGIKAADIFERLEDFFEQKAVPASRGREHEVIAVRPRLGPMLVIGDTGEMLGQTMVGMGGSPELGVPQAICMLPFNKVNGKWDIDAELYQAIGTPENGHPLGTVWHFPDDAGQPGSGSGIDPDWSTWRLPEWIQRLRARYVAVFMFYHQSQDINNSPFVYKGNLPDNLVALLKGNTVPNINGIDAKAAVGLALAGHPNLSDKDTAHAAIGRAIGTACKLLNDGTDTIDVPEGILVFSHDEAAQGLTLALGSCQYAPGLMDGKLAYEGWRQLNARLIGIGDDDSHASLMILAGDQVYVDATAGLFDPTQMYDRFQNPYEVWLGNSQVKDAMRRLPVATMLDDHEIYDNWEPVAAPLSKTKAREFEVPLSLTTAKRSIATCQGDRDAGVRSFLRFQRPTRPDGPALPEPLNLRSRQLWFSFERQGIPIFMLNSRTERMRRTAGSPGPVAMFSADQRFALEQWLVADANVDRPKIVVAPSLFLPRHRWSSRAALAFGCADHSDQAALRSDSWDGYLETFYGLISYIADHGVRSVIFLSGDEHLGLFSSAQISRDGAAPVTAWTVHSPGLYTPYPFANAQRSDFMPNETIKVQSENGVQYQCAVATELFDGPGFVMVSLKQDAQKSKWSMRCEHLGAGTTNRAIWNVDLD